MKNIKQTTFTLSDSNAFRIILILAALGALILPSSYLYTWQDAFKEPYWYWWILSELVLPLAIFALTVYLAKGRAIKRLFIGVLGLVSFMFVSVALNALYWPVITYASTDFLASSVYYIGYGAPAVAAMLVVAVAVVGWRKKVLQQYIERLLIGSLLASIVAMAATTIYEMIAQYPSNPNLSAYVASSTSMILAPILFAVVGFLLLKRIQAHVRPIEVALFMVLCGLAMALAYIVLLPVPAEFFGLNSTGYFLGALTTSVLAIVFAVTIVWYLWYRFQRGLLRRK